MSLINEALKRAKDAQQKSPAVAPGPQLRPAESTPPLAANRGMGMMAPAIVILVVVAGLAALWLARQKPADIPIEAKTSAPASPLPMTKPPVQTAAVSVPAVVAVPAAVQRIAPATPAVTPLKLQAIFYVPGRSTAIINSKTVRMGDTLRGFRVAIIDRTSATLVSATETNVMTLEQ
jgi:hypothetical protein